MKPTSEKNRIEAFSDGIFTIAMTLLILEIRVPHKEGGMSNEELAAALLSLWPSFLAFLTSFLTILIMWVNHHGLFELLHRADRTLLFSNGMLLLVVTFLPFPTALVAQHLAHPGARTAAMVYCGTFVLVSISYMLVLWCVEQPHLLRHDIPREHLRKIWKAYIFGFATYVCATILAAFAPLAATLLCSVLWVLWMRLDYAPPPSIPP